MQLRQTVRRAGPLIKRPTARGGSVIGHKTRRSGSRASSHASPSPISGRGGRLGPAAAAGGGRVSRGYMGVCAPGRGIADIEWFAWKAAGQPRREMVQGRESKRNFAPEGFLFFFFSAGPEPPTSLFRLVGRWAIRPIGNEDQLIREIAARAPGIAARACGFIRDGLRTRDS